MPNRLLQLNSYLPAASKEKAKVTAVPRIKDAAAFKDLPEAVAEKVPNSVLSEKGWASLYTWS